jgi:hypothetical protein
MARTNPLKNNISPSPETLTAYCNQISAHHNAYVAFSPVYRPLSSTLPIEIWTDAWSLALMMRLVALHLRGT